MSATRSLSSSRKKKSSQPFYDASGVQTSARIIEDARRSVRALPTDRPYTPAAPGRILFGTHNSLSRPPSVYSIGARHFSEERLTRPNTSQKLAPIEKTVVTDKAVKVPSKKKLNHPPPTPVQSFQDLSILTSSSTTNTHSLLRSSSNDLIPKQSSSTSITALDSASRTSLSSNDSGNIELKKSQSSPVHSKRSLSAGAGRRILSGGSRQVLESERVVSAGDGRGSHVPRYKPGNKDLAPDDVSASSNQGSSNQYLVSERSEGTKSKELSSTPRKSRHSDSRKSSVTSIDLPFWDSDVLPLLKKLDSTPYDSVTQLCETCDLLWSSLETHSLLGRTGGVGGTKKRGSILRTVFRLLDHKNPHVLLKVARIILAMKVTSKNLLNVCKLLFAIAKSDKNDEIFKEQNICAPLVDLLLTVDPHSDPEATVYGLGTVKLLASNSSLRGQLGEAGVMRLLASTLQRCTENAANEYKKHTRNILVQLTGALRNLSDAMNLREEFLSACIVPRLASVLGNYISDVEIVFNISRLLSKLTIQTDCQAAVMQCPSLIPLLLQTVTVHASHADITVRVCFILGNLVADDPEARELIFFRYSALPTLNTVFDRYLSTPLEKVTPVNTAASGGVKNTMNTKQDVLIKLVRLVANLSVHPEAGPSITQDRDTIDNLLRILDLFSVSDHEELVLNTLATLNNLTYYADPSSFIVQRQTEVAEILVKIILVDNSDALLECTRVYGNLSRHPAVRKILADNKVDEMMVALLDSGRRELVYSACGVLVNLMTDTNYRQSLAENGGVRKLVEVLHDFGASDWRLASLVCKTLWNYSETFSSASLCFGDEETTQLIHLLQTYSNESFSLDLPTDTSDAKKLMLASAWQSEFLPVSNALLARIQTYSNKNSSQLEQLTEDDYQTSET